MRPIVQVIKVIDREAQLLVTFKVDGVHELPEGFVHIICGVAVVYHTYIQQVPCQL